MKLEKPETLPTQPPALPTQPPENVDELDVIDDFGVIDKTNDIIEMEEMEEPAMTTVGKYETIENILGKTTEVWWGLSRKEWWSLLM